MNDYQKARLTCMRRPKDAIMLPPGPFDVESYAVIRDRTLYIVVWGSEAIKISPIDWLLHLIFIPWYSPQHKRLVHLGHYLRFRHVSEAVQDAMADGRINLGAYDRVCFMGHSLGAAIAGLLQTEFAESDSTTSFLLAPPRCFLFSTPSLWNTTAYRYGHDIVTKLPPFFRSWRCTHLPGGDGFHPFRDHYPKNYINALDNK